MKILVNGGSLSRGPNSWVYHIQERLDCDMINLSQSGAGNTYVHETTIAELTQREYDFVLIQWTPFIRFDYKVSDIEQFNGTNFTSKYQSQQNDWPSKVVYPVNDQDYVEKDWIFGCGHAVNVDKDPALTKAFEGFYNYAGHSEYMYHALIKLISLQSYLKVKKIPYLFCFGRPFKFLDRYKHLNSQLDYQFMYTDQFVTDIARDNNWWDADGIHPSDMAYKKYADLVLPKIQELL